MGLSNFFYGYDYDDEKNENKKSIKIERKKQRKDNTFCNGNSQDNYIYSFNQNLCFINSSIQCLFHLEIFRQWILSLNFGPDKTLLNATKNLLLEMENEKYPEKSNVKAIKEEIGKLDERFQTNQQQDASEFISFFIGKLLEETQGTKDINSLEKEINELNDLEKEGFNRLWKRFFLRKGKSYIVDLFYGILKVETRNKKDDRLESIRFNMFNILELPIYYLNKEYNSIYLETILKYNFSKKKDNDDDQTYDITTIYRLPKYLIVFLNRTVNKNFLNLKVLYKDTLDLTEYICSTSKNTEAKNNFNLCGIIEYHTYNSKYGHYTATCLCDNQWYLFNDSYIEEENDIKSLDNAMIFFYERESN